VAYLIGIWHTALRGRPSGEVEQIGCACQRKRLPRGRTEVGQTHPRASRPQVERQANQHLKSGAPEIIEVRAFDAHRLASGGDAQGGVTKGRGIGGGQASAGRQQDADVDVRLSGQASDTGGVSVRDLVARGGLGTHGIIGDRLITHETTHRGSRPRS
jgi:hypothetical protein